MTIPREIFVFLSVLEQVGEHPRNCALAQIDAINRSYTELYIKKPETKFTRVTNNKRPKEIHKDA